MDRTQENDMRVFMSGIASGQDCPAPEALKARPALLLEYAAAFGPVDASCGGRCAQTLTPGSRTWQDALIGLIAGWGKAGDIVSFCASPKDSDILANHIYSCLAALAVFAREQKRSLRDQAAFNRHIEKTQTETAFCLEMLLELGESAQSLASLLEEFYALTLGLDEDRFWILFYGLARFAEFSEWLMDAREGILSDYSRRRLSPFALLGFVRQGDVRALEALRLRRDESLEEDPAHAGRIDASGLLDG